MKMTVLTVMLKMAGGIVYVMGMIMDTVTMKNIGVMMVLYVLLFIFILYGIK